MSKLLSLGVRGSRPAAATNQVPDESAVGEDAKRLESVEHPAHTCACAITLARHVVSQVAARDE